jgi:hypothetical protein
MNNSGALRRPPDFGRINPLAASTGSVAGHRLEHEQKSTICGRSDRQNAVPAREPLSGPRVAQALRYRLFGIGKMPPTLREAAAAPALTGPGLLRTPRPALQPRSVAQGGSPLIAPAPTLLRAREVPLFAQADFQEEQEHGARQAAGHQDDREHFARHASHERRACGARDDQQSGRPKREDTRSRSHALSRPRSRG